jgi:hypothetical protein
VIQNDLEGRGTGKLTIKSRGREECTDEQSSKCKIALDRIFLCTTRVSQPGAYVHAIGQVSNEWFSLDSACAWTRIQGAVCGTGRQSLVARMCEGQTCLFDRVSRREALLPSPLPDSKTIVPPIPVAAVTGFRLFESSVHANVCPTCPRRQIALSKACDQTSVCNIGCCLFSESLTFSRKQS